MEEVVGQGVGGIDVDQLMAEIEKPTGGAIVENPAAQEVSPEAAPEAAPEAQKPSWNPQEWEFEVNGRKIVPESRDKAMKWISLGHNYSQRVGELNKQQESMQKQLADYQAKMEAWKHYNQVDEYVAKNPEWWSSVQEAYKQRQATAQDPGIQSLVNPLNEKLSTIEQVISSIQEERQQAKIAQEDKELEVEIESTRKQFPTIDFNSMDDSGKPLELRILEHAREIGTKSFRAAARDYLFDHVKESAKADGLQKAAKVEEINAKKGIIGVSPTPKKVIASAQNVRSKSYDDLMREAIQELGAAP